MEPETPRARIISEAEAKTLVRKTIQTLESIIKKELGYEVHMGAELEFTVESNNNRDTGFSHAPELLSKSLADHKQTLFPESRLVGYSYREAGNIRAQKWCNAGEKQQYEAVLTHERKLPAANFADAIAGLQKEVLRTSGIGHSKRATVSPTNMQAIKSLRQQQSAHASAHLKSTSLESSIHGMCNGLHINFSLHAQKAASSSMPSAHALQTASAVVFAHHKPWLCATDGENMRWNALNHDMIASNVAQKSKEGSQYIENQIPSASNNPYIVILLQLAAIYHAGANHPATHGTLPAILQSAGIQNTESVIQACDVLATSPRETSLSFKR